jgi:hypothetical protein
MLSLASCYLVLDTVQLQIRAWMRQYEVQAACTVEIQVLVDRLDASTKEENEM